MASAAASSGKILSRTGLMTPWSTSAPILSSCSPLARMNRYSKRTRLSRARRSTLRFRNPRTQTNGRLRPQARQLAVGPAADRHHHAARLDHLERAEQRVAALRVEDHVLIFGYRFE